MAVQITALIILALIFFIGTWKPIHLGLLALTAAFGVGVFLAGMPFAVVMANFPISILVLLLGITYLFTIVRDAGLVDWIINKSLKLVGGRIALIPWVFFFLAIILGSLGSPLACTSLAPVAMFFARNRIDPVVMGMCVVLGGSAGGFAPISLFGLITNGIAADSGIETNPMLLFGTAIAFNIVAMTVVYFMFGGRELIMAGRFESVEEADDALDDHSGGSTSEPSENGSAQPMGGGGVATKIATHLGKAKAPEDVQLKLTVYQKITLTCLAALITLVIVLTVLELPVDVGVIALGLAMIPTLLYPQKTKLAVQGIDWMTILLVGGIVTYVGVLEHVGAMDMLGEVAKAINQPLLAALVLCLVGAIVSAFASTTGILGALIPLALPLMATGTFPGYALIVALALSSSLVDATPFFNRWRVRGCQCPT